MIYLFVVLLFWHLLYDFHWQGPYIAAEKGKHFFLLMIHALTWALGCVFILYFMGVLSWWQFPFLYITHLVCDYWKSHHRQAPQAFYLLYIDQAVHLLTLVVCAVMI